LGKVVKNIDYFSKIRGRELQSLILTIIIKDEANTFAHDLLLKPKASLSRSRAKYKKSGVDGGKMVTLVFHLDLISILS